jgi:RIO-like serine/threonine protein kinase
MESPRVEALLKRDALGRVELLEWRGARRVRRVACGGSLPGSAAVARALLARERRALERLADLDGVPRLESAAHWRAGHLERAVLVREFTAGTPLHLATSLPEDFFAHLAALVTRLHARGVCHNDLHKEQNVIVRPDGRPALIDFQLASVHPRGGRLFRSRVHDDLRHVDKHARRYLRPGRGPARVAPPSGARPPRSLTALLWRRSVKPLYNLVTRALPGARDGEARRDSRGPWPRWTPPLGPPGRAGD